MDKEKETNRGSFLFLYHTDLEEDSRVGAASESEHFARIETQTVKKDGKTND